jgi:thiol-disulfide isomerase/thioredoxin
MEKMFLNRIKYLLIILVFAASAAAGQTDEKKQAPELTGHKGWLNTEKPLSLESLKGKVVLLDFWTYGCINCIHIIPDLKKLEAKYPNELVVIGVHSGKFENERETENIRRIILRYELEHPVVNDADFKIWDAYGVNAWPTQILIDPAGYLVTKTTGEGQLGFLDRKIQETVADFRNRGGLDEREIKFVLEKDKFSDSPLLFPGKVLADAKTGHLFIADSNHNRIVITRLDGALLEIVGNGKAGFSDGDFQASTFNRPQGLAFDGTNLYVADTGNHSIRRVNLSTKQVDTIAGTGSQSYERKAGAGRDTGLNSPWDLQLVGKQLFVAMAGNHQLWRMDLGTNRIEPFAGSGREAREDGGLAESAFSQPSGLASDGVNLYVADSEANIIRAVNFKGKAVKTIAGGDLFDFGDKDGIGDNVRLQHPLGVAFWGKNILIADTYNHKIKILNPATRAVRTFSGAGKPGSKNGVQAEFYEPGGLSVAAGKLFIADTNNHSIRVIDLKTKQVSSLNINGLRSLGKSR